MKKLIIVLSTLLLLGTFQTKAVAQKEINNWKILAMISMQKVFDEEMGIDLEKPLFSKAVKKLNGTEITIKGYILPLKASKDQKYFILSAYPYNMCFFCGGAGPESVMEVFSTKPVATSKKMVKLKGTLRVNYDPTIGQVLYTLKNAEVVK
jgi:hypothetical protein